MSREAEARVAAHRDLVGGLFPALELDTFERVGDGWDCFTYLVHGEWIVQLPRLEEASTALRAQMALLPELAREVSAPIPVPVHTSQDPAAMAYPLIEGRSLAEADLPEAGMLPERLGRFLYDLHMVPLEFVGLRGRGPEGWREQYRQQLAVFRARVLPLMSDAERLTAAGMFERFCEDDANFRFPDSLVHRDLGPTHILATPTGDLAGVIDWGDAAPGDPAIDFSWLLSHAPGIGERTLAAYGGPPDPTFLERARFYDALGPWHEVTYGLETEQPAFIESGLAAVRDRLDA